MSDAEDSGMDEGPDSTQVKILLIEDNPDDERLTCRTLKKQYPRIQLHIARDGEEGIRLLGAEDFEPQLVLLDIKLPKLSGIEVLQHVKASMAPYPCPIVVFTSSDDEIEKARCFDAGAAGFVTKPIDVGAYAAVLIETADHWLHGPKD